MNKNAPDWLAGLLTGFGVGRENQVADLDLVDRLLGLCSPLRLVQLV